MIKRSPLVALLTLAACSGPPPAAPPPPAPPPLTASAAPTAALVSPPPPGLRLPTTVKPVRYKPTLTLVSGSLNLEGSIDIELALREPTSLVWLNAVGLTVSEAHLEVAGISRPARVVPGGPDHLGFAFDTAPAGAAQLHISYSASVSERDDRGVFAEKEDGASYIFSQFENIDARRAFPCFDEPSFKVPWQLTLKVKQADVALSNTPSLSELPAEAGMKVVKFAETKPLPSYLVAFAVGPFDLIDAGKAGRGHTPVRIVVPHGRTAEATYAVKTTPVLLERLEGFFGMAYPYEKLDVVALPHLVSFGAMENVGLITFFANGMLARREEETLSFQRRYADIIAHEMAHQWFGDLVTMNFWNDIWLNEAFATWMEEKTLAPWKPEWSWEAQTARGTAYAMGDDSLLSTRKIRQEILTKDDIQNAFDGITYNKGSAVIGMFETWVGPDKFQKGVQRYLGKHAYGSAGSSDFFAAISAEAGRDVAPAFSTFLDQPGIPLVTAKLVCEGKATPKLSLSQERYLPAGAGSAPATVWQIPICARYAAGKKEDRACTLLAAPTAELPLPGAKCPDWVLPNQGGGGYYHVAYAPKDLDALLRAGNKLSLAERLSVIRDMGAQVVRGQLPAGEVLAHLAELVKDPSPHIQSAAVELLGVIPDAVVTVDSRPAFARFVDKALSKRAQAIGLRPKAGESDDVRLLRPALVGAAALRGEDAALGAEADKLARAWLDDPAALEDDMVDVVLQAAAYRGDRALYDRLRAELGKTKDSRRRAHVMRAMTHFRDPALVREGLALFLSKDLDPREALLLLFQDRRMVAVTFAFVKENYDALLARLPGEIASFTPRLGDSFCSEPDRAEVEAFFKGRVEKVTGAPRTLAQVLEEIKLCSAQRELHAASLAAFLKKP
jgi:cytosol alanyl aminopeptidase